MHSGMTLYENTTLSCTIAWEGKML